MKDGLLLNSRLESSNLHANSNLYTMVLLLTWTGKSSFLFFLIYEKTLGQKDMNVPQIKKVVKQLKLEVISWLGDF